MHLTRDDIAQFITATLAAELDAMRPGRTHDSLSVAHGRLDHLPVGASEREMLRLAGRVCQCLHLDGLLSADELVASPWVDRWAILSQAARAMPQHHGHVTFMDRTMGDAIPATHTGEHLARHATSIARIVRSRSLTQRVVCLTQPDSPMGLISASLLPAALDAEVLDDRLLPPRAVIPMLRAGDLVVVRGDQVAGLLHAADDLPPASLLVIDAPLDPETWLQLKERGMADTLEVHSTIEAGPMAWRDGADQPFVLLEHWLRLHAGAVVRDFDGQRFDLALHALWLDSRRFALAGATSANPVGPAQRCGTVAAVLRAHPAVLDVAVRPTREPSSIASASAGGIATPLTAYVIPRHDATLPQDLLATLRAFATERLLQRDRPVSWTIGPAMAAGYLFKNAG